MAKSYFAAHRYYFKVSLTIRNKLKFENVGFDWVLLHLGERRSFCFPDDFDIIVNELILNFAIKSLGNHAISAFRINWAGTI